MKSFERVVLAHLNDITGPMLDALQFAYRANRSANKGTTPQSSYNIWTNYELM